MNNAESVRQFQPRVCFETLGSTPSELRLREMGCDFPGLPKRNPGLELTNAFSVIHFR